MRHHIPTYPSIKRRPFSRLPAMILLVGYVTTIVVMPIAFTSSPVKGAENKSLAEEEHVCTGMACSIANADHTSCCCAPEETAPAVAYPHTISSDCTESKVWNISTQRVPWINMPSQFVNETAYQISNAHVAFKERLHGTTNREGIDKIPILLSA